MEISIIIPVYNVALYIEKCIDSIMKQTFSGSMECIIIDDCSTDDSMTIAERIISNYNGPIQFNIQHHHCNRGLSAARNTGIEFAKGDYIYFLDSDDWITDYCIELLMSKIKENPSLELVQAYYYHVYTNETCLQQFIPNEDIYITTNEDIRHYYFNTPFINVQAWNKLIKRSIIKNNSVLFKEGIIFEDYLWGFHLIKYLSSICLIPDATYYFLTRPKSIRTGVEIYKQGESYRLIYLDILSNLTSGHKRQEFYFFSQRFALTYTKYVHEVPEFKDLMILYKQKAKLYGTWTTRMKLFLAQLLGNFQEGNKVAYWLKLQKKNIDTFRNRWQM